MANPYKPAAGMTPPVLVGCQRDLNDFSYALDDGVEASGRLMYVTGARGVGKTVMFNVLGDLARQPTWQVIDETAESKFMQRLIETLRQSPRRSICNEGSWMKIHEPSLHLPCSVTSDRARRTRQDQFVQRPISRRQSGSALASL